MKAAWRGSSPTRAPLRAAQRLGRLGQWPLAREGEIARLPGKLGGWTRARDLMPMPTQTFREWWTAREAEQEPGA